MATFISVSFIIYVFHCLTVVYPYLEINFYSTIGQLKQDQVLNNGQLELFLTSDQYSDIIRSTINIDGNKLGEQDLYSSNELLRNQDIYLKSNLECHCNTTTNTGKIIDPYNLLIKQDNRYIYVERRQLQFTKDPQLDGMILKISLNDTKVTKANLTYLTNGLSWQPRYDIVVENEQSGKVKAFADIVNNHQRSYKIDKTSLITGNTPIVSSNTVARPLYMSTAMISSPTSSNFGTYSYSIIKSYTLLPQSVKTFPFITPTIVLNYRLEATTYLESTGVIDGLFQRLFSIRPSEFLPSGTVTFYQTNGFCLGQGTIPDTSKNFTQTIALGDDPDVHYTIQSVTTQVRQTPAYGQDLNITITVSNQKDQQIVSVKLELTSGYSNTTFVNKNRNCKIIQDQITQSLIFTTTLKPAQEEKCTITVSQTN